MSARLTDEQRRLRLITEAVWQERVTALAARWGWKLYAPPRNGARAFGTVRTVVPGFPDLTLVRGPRLLFAELKREVGKTTPEQDRWHDALRAAGAPVYVWRPRDLPEVRAVLRPDLTEETP